MLEFCSPPYARAVTVLEVIQRSSDFLARKHVDSPRLQSELLLAHVLQMPRMKLYLNFERRLEDSELDTLREFVKRRGDREPLQHILGSACFGGLDLAVNQNVLVPRPETELLAEKAVGFIGGRQSPVSVLDFGTGSGCLAIYVAVRCPSAAIIALDISTDALEVARGNASRHGVAERIRFVKSDGFAALDPGQNFDLIVSNPPYIATGEIAHLDPEVRDYDPCLALDGGADGLDFYRRLASQAGDRLAPEGRLMLEIGDGQKVSIERELVERGWLLEEVIRDYSGHERILIALRTG